MTPRSLQARLLAWVLGLAALVWVSAAAVTWVDAQHELDELLDGHLAQVAALLMVQADGDEDDLSNAPALHKYAPQVIFQVFVAGELITRSVHAGTEPISTVRSGFSTVRDSRGVQWRVFASLAPASEIQVFVGENMESRRAILWAVLRSMLWPVAIALPLFGMALWWSVRKGLAPLNALSASLEQRPPHALEPLPVHPMPRELRPLVQALNTLLQRIERMVFTERRFTADAAHELRTPIAGIRAQAQVALGAGNNTEQRVHALHATLEGCDRATRLVEQLLTLARLEAAVDPALPRVDVAAVARTVAADLAPAALARNQVLELDAPAPCLVAADEVLLGVLVRNLLDNALRYSPLGAQVQVAVSPTPAGHVVLRVQDSGPGIPEEAMQRLGERFYRVLGSGQPGSGLGWSIVKRLVEVFGASVQVQRSASLGGLDVEVLLPAVSPGP